MKQKVSIKPNKKLIKDWVKNLIPFYDVFFFCDMTNINEIDNRLITMDEYIKNFSNIDYINAYEHWNVKIKAKYVYVDYDNSLLLNENNRNFIYQQQIKCGRGLVLDSENRDEKLFKIGMYQNKIILTNYLFNQLDYKHKEKLTIKYAKDIDDWYGYTTNDIPNYINQVANKFVECDGCNCLSTTIYGASCDDDILLKWLDGKFFAKKLKELKYLKKSTKDFKSTDIVVFMDKQQNVIHACYCVNKDLFLNKSGQSRFNPITLLPFEHIKNDWIDYEYYVFSKENL